MANIKEYYIYGWFDVDNGNMFYVGKGTGRRKGYWNKRNNLFKEYYNNHNCDVIILEDNILDEDCAYEREVYWITLYKSEGQCQTNIMFGGKNPPILSGKENGMWGKTHTDDVKELLRKINSDGRNAKENNSQFGISPKERMDEETYNGWIEKHKLAMIGCKNPQYGISPYERIPKNKIDKWKENLSKSCSGDLNGNHKPIALYNDLISKDFSMIKNCAIFLIENNYSKSSVNGISSSISSVLHSGKKYLGFYYKYI